MKIKFFSVFIAVSLISIVALAQTSTILVKPAGSKYWGFANEKGEMVIPAQYAKVYAFCQSGYATVYNKKARQYIFIDIKGQQLTTEITSFKIHDGFGFNVKGFVDGLIAIKVGEKWGYLNFHGKLAIPAKYDAANEFNDGFATAKSGIDYVVIDKNGNESRIEGAGIIEVKKFSESFAPYRDRNKQYGFVDNKGGIAIKAQFESVGYFSDGLAWAKTAGKQVGYINTKGDWVIQPQFATGKNFDASTGLARIKTSEGRWTYVNKSGKMVHINDTDAWGDFSEGLAAGRKEDKKGFYDAEGKWVIAPQFEGVRNFKNGYAAAKVGKKWGMIDKTGQWVIQPNFDGIKDLEVFNP
jgi:hypothetical protein